MIPENSETYLGFDLSTQKVNSIYNHLVCFSFGQFISPQHAIRSVIPLKANVGRTIHSRGLICTFHDM